MLCLAERTRPIAHRAGKGASYVTEQLGLHQPGRTATQLTAMNGPLRRCPNRSGVFTAAARAYAREVKNGVHDARETVKPRR